MPHLKRLVPTAVLAVAMLVVVNFVSAPKTYADGPYGGTCASWVTQYQRQLVQGAPRWVLQPDFYGVMRWRLVPVTYYTTVPVQVCVSYVTAVTYVAPAAQTVIYAPQPIYPLAYGFTPYGYIPTVAFYGPYKPRVGFDSALAPQ